MEITRRELITSAAAAASAGLAGCSEGQPDDGWRRGPIRHLLPTASHQAFNIKLSLAAAVDHAPLLQVGDRSVQGVQQDTAGRFWAFRIGDLAPATQYKLELRAGDAVDASRLCDPWPLRTFPAPDARPEALRVIAYTCAGGPNLPTPPALFHAFKPTAYRARLFDRMLERAPDLVIANGDHVYFDLPQMGSMRKSLLGSLVASFVEGVDAIFDAALPVLGTPNESALTTIGDDQIAGIYGVRFRSTPMFFVTDDHDYFLNDDATPERITMPPNTFHMSLRNALQQLYFPEFILEPEHELGPGIPGRHKSAGVTTSSHFGEVRYGDLFAALFYDCGGYLGLDFASGLVPESVENWLLARTRQEDTAHLVHVPSHPVGWTAGKWREWYPDVLESSGSLVAGIVVDEDGAKYAWQRGWWEQHQRLLTALSAQARRKPLVVSGDLHALGITRIEQSSELDLRDNPVYSVLAGPVGVGDLGWPSRARGVASRTPEALRVTELLALEERNGFTVLDFDRAGISVDLLGCPTGWTDPSVLDVSTAARFDLA